MSENRDNARRLEHTIASFVKAVAWVTMRGENSDTMTEVLEADSRINDQSFCPPNTQVRVEENNAFWLRHGSRNSGATWNGYVISWSLEGTSRDWRQTNIAKALMP